MANRKTTEFIRLFKKLHLNTTSSNHHIRGFLTDLHGNTLYPPVYISKGKKEVPHCIEKKIIKCLCINSEQFKPLISCKTSREQYLNLRGKD